LKLLVVWKEWVALYQNCKFHALMGRVVVPIWRGGKKEMGDLP
jgi:hypothetical protein